MEKRLRKVHISYKHDKDHLKALEAIKLGLKKNNIEYSIDEYDVLYRDDIQEYEKEIGLSDRVIMFVTPSYLTSIDCMYEMTQLFKNGSVNERVFPVVDMGEVPRNGDGLNIIKDYWQKEKERKSEQLKHVPNGSFEINEIKKITDILNVLDDFWELVVHNYSGSYDELLDNDAALLMKEIKKSPIKSQTEKGDKHKNVVIVVLALAFVVISTLLYSPLKSMLFEKKIMNIVGLYQDASNNNNLPVLEKLYAAEVKQYYGVYNISRDSVLKRHNNYEKVTRAHNPKCVIDYGSLRAEKLKDGSVKISYRERYDLDREDSSKNTTWDLEKHFLLDKRYKIIKEYEVHLRKGRLQ